MLRVLPLLVLFAACSTKNASPTGMPGGVVAGASDAHCGGDGGARIQTTSPAACHPIDAGLIPGDGGASAEFGATLFNAEGDDDDCKYHVAWSSTPVYEKYDVTFTVAASARSNGVAIVGAAPYMEVLLNDTHPAPNSHPQTTETSPGTYAIGPVQFDAPGEWTVRFHLFGDCADLSPQSPHGHVAFFVRVP